ncbi:GNAT family N-acetyltransferase [Dyadobacter sp. CY345]|uniref:GNAT family N-acetyltransferase n=1 Tax=Dyadobacter sp. CY345 TaxID=2909335 RepID=UPI001F454868|nr:GNAT family N-acetyltransferase [Dyadobacter sp. CY345]MCF2442806.1 GNAT family N-acetyltransferase [Dyadobacter sp. CY345]
MKNLYYTWIEGLFEVKRYLPQLPVDEFYTFQPDLFNTSRHLETQGEEAFSFHLYRKDTPEILAVIHFFKRTDKPEFLSPIRASFGGINCHENCPDEALYFLLSCVINTAMVEDQKFITITNWPSCYNTKLHERLNKIYITAGFGHFKMQRNLHIEVGPSLFPQTISGQESRRLNKCKKAGFFAMKEENVPHVTLYNFIQNSFNEKNYPLSISESHLLTLFTKFPNEFLLFTVRDQRRLVAVSVAVRINRSVLYIFLMADLMSYRSFSPGVMLYEELYNYCQKEQITILDQGISVDNHGDEKPELIRFKKNMGGKESLKITYNMVLNN